MKIAGFEYNLNHKALEIYLSGCKGPYCPGCHNIDLWDFNLGWEVEGEVMDSIKKRVKDGMIEQVWILGGEPQDQDIEELNKLLSNINKPIVLFTRYTFLKDNLDTSNLHYVKYGPYGCLDDSYVEPVLGIELASRNQYVERIKP